MLGERIGREFYQRNVVLVARELLGQRIVRLLDGRRISGTIVETEAYLGAADKAAHTCGGRRTKRNASMWGDGGYAYVYFTYGMHHCLNVVAGVCDEPVAILLRAVEPDEGIELMQVARPAAKRTRDLCSGPAKLCQALRVTRELDHTDLVDGDELFIERAISKPFGDGKIVAGARIGVAYAEEWADKPLRFWLDGNPNVSR